MNLKNITKNIISIIHNYNQLLKKSLYFIIYLTLVIFSSLVITLPLWYIATKYSKVYTIAVIISVLIALGFILSTKILKWVDFKQKEGIKMTQIILIPLKKAGIFILFLIGFYIIVLTYSIDFFIIAVLLSITYLLILGYFIFILRKNAK